MVQSDVTTSTLEQSVVKCFCCFCVSVVDVNGSSDTKRAFSLVGVFTEFQPLFRDQFIMLRIVSGLEI